MSNQTTTDAAFQLLQVGYVLVIRPGCCCSKPDQPRALIGVLLLLACAASSPSLLPASSYHPMNSSRVSSHRLPALPSRYSTVPQRLPCTYSRVVSPHHTSPLSTSTCAQPLSQPLQHHISFAPSVKYCSAATLHPPSTSHYPWLHPCHMSSVPSNPFPPTAP